MENLVFSLNATLPVFSLMLLGMLFKKMGLIDDDFASKMNRFVFVVALPVLLFEDLATTNIYDVWDTTFVLFCFIVTVISILLVIFISYLLKNHHIQGEFIHVSYRSSAALLGIAFMENIYGDTSMIPLMIIGSVPLYNIMAVVVLSFYQPHKTNLNKELIMETIKGICTNPIIIAIIIGLLYSILALPMPPILSKTVSSVGSIASPLGLIAMGASFQLNQALKQKYYIILSTFMKLAGFCILFLPIATLLGFTTQKLVAILIMLGSPTTVSCYIMAKNMNHEGVLTSGVIMLTTLLSAFSITFWLYLLRSLALI